MLISCVHRQRRPEIDSLGSLLLLLHCAPVALLSLVSGRVRGRVTRALPLQMMLLRDQQTLQRFLGIHNLRPGFCTFSRGITSSSTQIELHRFTDTLLALALNDHTLWVVLHIHDILYATTGELSIAHLDSVDLLN